MIEPSEKENDIRPLATSAEVELSLGDHRPLVYRSEAPLHSSVHRSSVKKSSPYSLMKSSGHQREKMKRTSPDEEMVKVEPGSSAKLEGVIDSTLAAFDVLQPKAKSASHLLKLAMGEYCFVNNTSCNELEDLHDLETGSALHQNMRLMLADSPTHQAQCGVRQSLLTMCFAKRTSRGP